MSSSDHPDEENQQPATPADHLKLSTAELCRRAPDLFCNFEPPSKPSFTLDDWAARNPVIAAA